MEKDRIQCFDAVAMTLWSIAVLLLFATVYSFASSWPHRDGFIFFYWLKRWRMGSLSWVELLLGRNNEHPIGFHYPFSLAALWLADGNFKILMYISASLVAAAAGLLLVLLRGTSQAATHPILVVLTVLIPLLNPVQVSYLLWEFQLWWYWVLLFLIMTTVLLEKFVLRAYPLIFLLCVCATFCGVPGLFLWLSTGTHFLLLSWQGDSHCSITIRTGAKIALLHLGIFLLNAWCLVAGVPPSSASSMPAGGLVSAAIGSIVYFCQLLGSPFGRRDIAIAFTAGTVSLVIWLVCVFRIVFQLRLHDLAVRIGLLLTSTALLWALAFAYGRQKHGIQWALWTFHASPMLLPFFVGLGTLAVRLLTSETSYAILTTAALGTLVAFLPSLTAMPFGQVRSAEMLRIASTAHVVSCNPGDYSMYLQLRLNGLEAHRDLYELSAPLARESCVREVNQDAAQELLVPPKEYAHLLTKDAPTHAALQTLWEVYMTRIDLQRAFPPSSPILTQKLLEFAYCNAKAGSNYEREQLAVHAQIYLEIGSHDAYGGRC